MARTLLKAGIAAALISSSLIEAAAVAELRWYTPIKYYTAAHSGYYNPAQYYTPKQYYTPPGGWPAQATRPSTHPAASWPSPWSPAASFGSHGSTSNHASAPSSTARASTAASSSGKNVPSSGSPPGSCPQIWSQVASTLKSDFSGCNDLARSAIRFAFHDAGGYSSSNSQSAPASGGADGSLLLNDDEISRSSEAPMKERFRDPYLLPLYQDYKDQGVGAADLAQFAGAVGIKSCSGGPTIKVLVGRKDSSTAAPQGTLPAAFGQGSDYESLIKLWGEKGFSPRELAALMGAHTVSTAFAQGANGIPPGAPQDSDPTVWDNNFYVQTQSQKAHSGVYSFASDVNLSNATTECGKAFTDFGKDQATWNSEFSAAMQKLSVLGIDQGTVSGFTDCTSLIS